MTILLIEPDVQLGQIYMAALQRAGHSVYWQRDAQSAIEAANTAKPDVVILEIQLARHNGVEFLYEFRSYPDWQETPILLNTNALDLPADEHLLSTLGVKAIHYKPQTTLGELIASVERLRDIVIA